MVKRYTFDDFRSIIETLRSADGCPWDKVQTHESLKRCLIEEAYEVIDGIDQYNTTGNYQNLKEELGDVLLQVCMHAQIAKEESIFDLDDIIHEISQKMIRRHPHVFAKEHASTEEEVVLLWDDIKEQEKIDKKEETLSSVPKAFPALLRAEKVQKRAAKLYQFTIDETSAANNISEISNRIQNYVCLTKEKEDKNELNKMIGELLFYTAALAKENHLDAEDLLEKEVNGLIHRLEG